MTIPQDQEAEILRLYHAEKWTVNAIALFFNVHHSVIERVLENDGVRKSNMRIRPSITDPFIPFIKEKLEQYPDITATRLYAMARERNYPGQVDHFRDVVARYRRRPTKSAYLSLTTLPGEQAQVDWGSFGKLVCGNAKRYLMAFVMVLSYSRMIFLRFFPGASMGYFLQGHVDAFSFFQGIPREILTDNLKSVVLERRHDAIRLNPKYLELSGHYLFAPKPVNVRRGNEKGRCERAIRYIRDSFFMGRKWSDLADLNGQAIEWCQTVASQRKCPGDPQRTVGEAFEMEKATLIALPDDPFPSAETILVRIGKTPYAQFDCNKYSVPYTCVGKLLTVSATLDTVRLLDGAQEVARHERSLDKGQQVENDEHIRELLEQKKEAKQHRGMDKLNYAVPSSRQLFEKAALRGQNLGALTQGLLKLIDQYGQEETELAVQSILQTESSHVSAIRQVLEQRRHERGLPVPVPVHLPDDPRIHQIVVKPQPLSIYDDLCTTGESQP